MEISIVEFADEIRPIAIKSNQLDLIKKIYTGYFNTGQDTETFVKEFFYTVGNILSGKELKDLDLKYLNVEELL